MSVGWEDRYRADLRAFLERHGRPANINPDAEDELDEVDTYGWLDFRASNHIDEDGCRWIVPEGATLAEGTYLQFVDTLTGNDGEVGINAHPARCVCGTYTDVTLRFAGSLDTVLRHLFANMKLRYAGYAGSPDPVLRHLPADDDPGPITL